MSHWIYNFPPPISGSYLVRTPNGTKRRQYVLEEQRWYNDTKDYVLDFSKGYSWWDEYGLTDNKKPIRLNLKI